MTGGMFNNCYSVMTETVSPYFDESEVAVFLAINTALFKRYLMFTNLEVPEIKTLMSTLRHLCPLKNMARIKLDCCRTMLSSVKSPIY